MNGSFGFKTKDCPDGSVGKNGLCHAAGSEQNSKLSATTCSDPDLSKVSTAQTITLCNGSTAKGTLAICATDGQTNCIVTDKLKAADTTTLTADKIKLGVTVAGVTGTKRDIKMCRNAAYFSTQDQSSPSNLPMTVTQANVNVGANTLTFTNVHGLTTDTKIKFTDVSPPTPLVLNTTYYAMVVSSTVIKIAANAGDATEIDLTSNGPAAGTTVSYVGDSVADNWDTVDDYNNGANNPSPNMSPWSSNYICNETNFTNVAGGSHLNPSKTTPTYGSQSWTEIWQDALTGMYFTNILYTGGGSTSWSEALRLCTGLDGTSDAGTGWRLPTQKELLQAYVDGMAKVAMAGGTLSANFLTSSHRSNQYQAWVNWIANAGTGTNAWVYQTTYSVICTRE